MKKNKYSVSSCDFFTKFDKKLIKKSLSKSYCLNFKKSLFLFDKLHGCSLLIEKKCLQNLDLFNTDLKHVQDYDMWLRLAKKYDILHIQKPLLVSRIHALQSSKKFKIDAEQEKELFFNKYLNNNSRILSSIKKQEIILFFF